MVNSKFNEQTQILESHFKNNVCLNEVLDYIIATKENTSYPRKLKILTHAEHASFKFSFANLNTIITENNKSLEKYDSIIDAIIIDSPEAAALTVLYQELAKNNKYHFSVFSTEEAALIWLETF